MDRSSAFPQAQPPTDEAQTDEALRHAIEAARELQARALERLDDTLAGLLTRPAGPGSNPAAASDDAVHPAAASDANALSRVLDAIRHLDRAASLADILETLGTHASRVSSRCALLMVADEHLRGWSHAGLSRETMDRLTGPIAGQSGVIARAIRSRAASVSAEDTRVAGGLAFAAPLIVGRHVVGVLYAEGAPDEAPNPAELTMGAWPQVLEALVSHAARCLEAVTVSRLLGDEPSDGEAASGSSRPEVVGRAGASVVEGPEAARRYARLLVSEIRLYHGPEIEAGRRDGDLAVRLGEPIARARELYEARIPSSLPERDEYFETELVRGIADGDVALLGDLKNRYT